MIAVDTNILVHAHRREMPQHAAARAALIALAVQPSAWGIPLHCLAEFYSVVTKPSLWKRPSTPVEATRAIASWRQSPSFTVLADRKQSVDTMLEFIATSGVVGPKVYDARIAAVCHDHGVSALWTFDRDYAAFPLVRTVNPLFL